MKAIHFFNGQFLPKEEIQFSVDDVGLLRGYSVFEYFKAYNGIPVFMKEHLNRFENSAALFGIKIPFSRQRIEEAILRILKQNKYAISGIKILLTGGDSPNGFSAGKPNMVILNLETEDSAKECYIQGVSVMSYNYTREFPQAKTTNYATAVMLESTWKKGGHFDVLYFDGVWVTEVARSNVFVVKGNQLITNQFGVLSGISRSKVVEMAPSLGFEIEIRPVSLQEVLYADEFFMTSTNKRVMPIVKVDEHLIANGLVGEKTKKLMSAFDQLIKTEISSGI
jgi:branched-chain amino acid aminotransferase